MRFIATWCAALASQLLVCASLSGAMAQGQTLAGATPGGLGADPAGAATYSIPIVVPPGIGAVAPALTLRYSSLGGPGLPGYGWGLEGLSTITRCPRTRAQDGIAASQEPPSLATSDRFCLDGQRLVLVNGTYGGDGAEYRTEIESFARIRSYGGGTEGPRWFEIKTKAGITYHLGDAPNLESGGSGLPESYVNRLGAEGPIFQWMLGRVADAKNNVMRVLWTPVDGTGSLYPTEYSMRAAHPVRSARACRSGMPRVPTPTAQRPIAGPAARATRAGSNRS